EVQALTPDAMGLLQRYPWPGNIRELQSILKQALLQAAGAILVPEFLPACLRADNPGTKAAQPVPGAANPAETANGFAALGPFLEERLQSGGENLYDEMLRRLERLLLTRVLQHTGGNQLQAAKLLGITRGSLRTKLRELGITIARSVASSGEVE